MRPPGRVPASLSPAGPPTPCARRPGVHEATLAHSNLASSAHGLTAPCPSPPAGGRCSCAWATAGSAGTPTPQALTDPQLVDEDGPVGVELVVADPAREHYQGARVVDR